MLIEHEAEMYARQMVARTKQDWVNDFKKFDDPSKISHRIDWQAIRYGMSLFEDEMISHLNDKLTLEEITQEELHHIIEILGLD